MLTLATACTLSAADLPPPTREPTASQLKVAITRDLWTEVVALRSVAAQQAARIAELETAPAVVPAIRGDRARVFYLWPDGTIETFADQVYGSDHWPSPDARYHLALKHWSLPPVEGDDSGRSLTLRFVPVAPEAPPPAPAPEPITIAPASFTAFFDDDPAGPAVNAGGVIGYWAPGDWVEWTVTLPDGVSLIRCHVACAQDGGRMIISIDGATAGTFQVPNTASWETFQPVDVPATIPAGQHTIRLLGSEPGAAWHVGDLQKLELVP